MKLKIKNLNGKEFSLMADPADCVNKPICRSLI